MIVEVVHDTQTAQDRRNIHVITKTVGSPETTMVLW